MQQTDVRRASSLNASYPRGGGITRWLAIVDSGQRSCQFFGQDQRVVDWVIFFLIILDEFDHYAEFGCSFHSVWT